MSEINEEDFYKHLIFLRILQKEVKDKKLKKELISLENFLVEWWANYFVLLVHEQDYQKKLEVFGNFAGIR